GVRGKISKREDRFRPLNKAWYG
ncbi:hypothetical protein CCACVL1_01209, partial [Corchorus capsularis]